MTARDSLSKYEQYRKHIAYESPCEKAERVAIDMRTKKRAQLRETARSKVRERSSQGSAYENEPPLEETKTSHDTLSALDNNLHISVRDEAIRINALTNNQAYVSVIQHTLLTQHHHELPLTPALQDIPGEEV